MEAFYEKCYSRVPALCYTVINIIYILGNPSVYFATKYAFRKMIPHISSYFRSKKHRKQTIEKIFLWFFISVLMNRNESPCSTIMPK